MNKNITKFQRVLHLLLKSRLLVAPSANVTGLKMANPGSSSLDTEVALLKFLYHLLLEMIVENTNSQQEIELDQLPLP